EKFTGTLKDSSAEGDLRWVREADLFDLELWEGDRIFLKWFLEGRFFSGKFIYEDGKLVDHHVIFHEVAPRE
ncbi:MAG: DNA mismatch repair protein MutT, partial [Candidatus Omnitrophica bacterium]|nr:DNA mismatch repair protein MutT [Candidatus Omnitrophota bacterium]